MRLLNSADYQIPQSRRRMFIVGYLDFGMRKINFVYLKDISYRNAAKLRRKNPQKLIGGAQGQRVCSVDGAALTQRARSGGRGGKTKMAGNAVSVPVVAAVGKKIREVIF